MFCKENRRDYIICKYSSSYDYTVVSDILIADILKSRLSVGHLSGCPIRSLVGQQHRLDMSNIVMVYCDEACVGFHTLTVY